MNTLQQALLDETLMDNSQDFLVAFDDANITGYDIAVALIWRGRLATVWLFGCI